MWVGRTALKKPRCQACRCTFLSQCAVVDKFRRGFICSGSDSVHGGRCLVPWSWADWESGYALRLIRWEWQARTAPDKSWTSIAAKPEKAVQAMFDASVTVEVGSGQRTLFWQDRWLNGRPDSSGPETHWSFQNRGRRPAKRSMDRGHHGISLHYSACALRLGLDFNARDPA
jgi:hypothetical protein